MQVIDLSPLRLVLSSLVELVRLNPWRQLSPLRSSANDGCRTPRTEIEVVTIGSVLVVISTAPHCCRSSAAI